MKRSHSERKDADQDPDAVELDDLEPVMAADEVLDDLEVLEAEEIDDLEEWTDDDQAAQVEVAPASEDGFDLRFDVDVGAMEKGEILAAIAAPLRRKVDEAAAQVRWQRVVVTFTGEAMVPSGVKDLVAEIVATASPVSVTVQRGYPDESVYTAKLPTCEVRRTQVDAAADAPAHLLLDVETGGLTGDDLALALAAELAALCEQADGRAFAFRFHGDAEVSPDSYCTPLIEAGASRIVLTSAGGDHVLYDRVLEELVTVSGDGDKATIEVAGGRDQMTTLRALSLVLAQSTASLSGKDVTAHFPADLPASEFVEVLLATAKEFAFARMATHDGEVLWPPVLQSASKGRRTALRLREGMSPGLANSVRRALADISIEGQDVEFDWPSDSTPDADVTGLLVAANPASVVYTIGKEQDELVHPAPVSFQTEDDVLICGVDTSIGKPAVLVPAIERAMRAQSVAGQKVELHILGGGMLTRTMRAAMVNALLEGDAAQARLVEGDDSEFLFPALLDFEALDSGHVRLTVTVADRSPEEVASAFAGEFAASDLAQGATLRVADAMFVARLVEVGADRILLEGDTDVQAHPTLIRATSKDGDRILIDAAPDADDVQAQVDRELEAVLTGFGDLTSAEITVSWPGESDARAVMLERILAAGPALLSLDDAGEVTQLHPPTVRTCVDILGQREGGDLPMIMLGIDTGDDEAVSAALGELQERIQGRRVLVVYRTDGREVAGAADDAVVQATRAALGSAARAVLQFCPKTRAAPAHFEVVATNVEAVVLGSKVKDPRG